MDMADKDKKNMVKARLLVVTDMFNEKTDEHHCMDTFEIIDEQHVVSKAGSKYRQGFGNEACSGRTDH